MFPTTSKAPDIDIITVTVTGTGHNVNVAPSGNKRWVVGFSIVDAAPPPILDKLVRLLEEACIQLKADIQAAKAAKHATDATDQERTGVKRKSPSDSDMARPVERQRDRGDEGWLSRGGDELGAWLFSLAGLPDAVPARYHDGWYSRSNCLCPWGCTEGKVHTNSYILSMNKYGTLSLSYANKDEHMPGSLVVQLDADLLRTLQVCVGTRKRRQKRLPNRRRFATELKQRAARRGGAAARRRGAV
jgi:hypothetical protein